MLSLADVTLFKEARLCRKGWRISRQPQQKFYLETSVFSHNIVAQQSYVYAKRKLNQVNNTTIRVSANRTTCIQTSRKIDSKPSSLTHNCERRGGGVMAEIRRTNALNSRIKRIYLFHKQSEVANLFIGCPQSNDAVTMEGIIDHLNWLTFHSSERVHQRHVYNILPISNPDDPLRRILICLLAKQYSPLALSTLGFCNIIHIWFHYFYFPAKYVSCVTSTHFMYPKHSEFNFAMKTPVWTLIAYQLNYDEAKLVRT